MKRFFVIAAIATLATVAQAQQQKASDKKKAAATSPAPTTVAAASPAATAAATTSSSITLDNEAQATAGKSWSMTFVNQTSMDSAQANYSNVTNKSFSALNYIGGGYKLDKNNRMGLRQYFTLTHDGSKNTNKTVANDTVLTYTRSNIGSFAGSDPLSSTFWYYAPTSEASRNVRSSGQIRMDMELAWTLSPKWTVSYVLIPRQNFIPEGILLDAEGKENPVFSKTVLIHYANLYYSFNDSFYAYGYAGYDQRWKTSSMTMTDQDVMTALGGVLTLAGGKIQVIPEISVSSTQVKGAQHLASEEVLQEKNVTYFLTSAFVF